MRLLLVINRRPYDGTDVTWNALRLAAKALETGMTIRIFLLNDAIDLAHEDLGKGVDYDLQGILLETISEGAETKLCKTYTTRCGIAEGKLRSEVEVATMPELLEWVADSDRVLTF